MTSTFIREDTSDGTRRRITLTRWEFNLVRMNAFALILALPFVTHFTIPRVRTTLDKAAYFGLMFGLINLAVLPLISEPRGRIMDEK
jgi:hypothetical protein